jgi:chromosome segregation ATPase
MRSKTKLKAQKKVDDASAQLRDIEKAKDKVAKERAEAEERLQNLKGKFPRLLARRALKQATDGEISAIKRGIMDLEALLAEFPLTLQGLDELERPIRSGMLDTYKGAESVFIATREAV